MTDLQNGKIYTGKVMHMRMQPFEHRFTYKVFSFLFDLDNINQNPKTSKLLGYNQFNLMSFYEKDHIPKDLKFKTTREYIDHLLEKANLEKAGKIYLLCYPRFLGFVFNPISIYYCMDENNQIICMIYEVRNTFKERHTYVEPVLETQRVGSEIRQAREKLFHVSPFMNMDQCYHFRVTKPSEKLTFRIFQTQDEQPSLSATFSAKAMPITTWNTLKAAVKTPFLTIKVVASIHYEALKIWIKGGKYHKPEKPEQMHSLKGDFFD